MTMLRYFVVLLFVIGFGQIALSQYPSYVSYSIENGGPSNEIYTILQDKDGYIWIGSDAGVYRFNGVQYEHFTSDDLQARSATGLIQTASGKIFGYNFKGQVFYVDLKGLHVIKNWIGPVNSLAEDNNGQIWLSSQKGNFVINDQTLEIKRQESKVVKFSKNGQPFTGNIRRNEAGKLYYHHASLLIERDLQGNETASFIDASFDLAPILISNSQDEPWLFGISENKVFRKEKGKWMPYTDSRLIDLLKDRKPNDVKQIDENLWINTHTGVIKFSLKDGSAELFYPNIAFSGCIKDNENNYWFSTLHHGLLKIPTIEIRAWNRHSGIDEVEQLSHVVLAGRTIFACGSAGELLEVNRINNKTLLLKHDPQSDIGMCYYDPIDKCVYFNKLSHIYQLKQGKIGLVNNLSRAVKSMLHVPEGYFFLSSQGIYFTKVIENDLELNNQISDGWFREICKSPFGNGYYVGGNGGLMKLDRKQGKWEISKNYLEKQVLSVSSDSQGKKVYFLTFDGEIYVIDQFGMCNLFSNQLQSYRASKLSFYKGALYLATIKGVLKVNIGTKQRTLLNIKRGLPSNNIRQLEIHNDTCWVASGKGLICIPLSSFEQAKVRGVVHNRGISLNTLPFTSNAIPTVQFDDLVTIFVDALSYSSNGDFQLAYRIIGHSENWIRVPGSLGRVEIPRLPSGDIVIEVKMIDANGSDSSNILKYRFKVIPPFWQRWWFYMLIVISVGAFAYLIFTVRIRSLRKKQRQVLRQIHLENELRLTQQNALKAQMNPHFLFNVLNSIKGYIYENDKKNAARYLSDFSNLVRKVLEMSSQVKVSLEEELEVLKVYIELEAMLLQSDFHYTITLDEKSDTAGITVPSLLIQPYIENAFKHGLRHKIGRKELHLRILLDDEHEVLTIEIQDNGIGRTASARINKENSPEHNSFATDAMQKRLELLNHEKKDLVGIEISDKFDSTGEAAGTIVTIRIHV